MNNDLEALRQKAALKLKWDRATLHKKIEEVIELTEVVRRRIETPEHVSSSELRVAMNELTRRTVGIELCRITYPEDNARINIVLTIVDDWIIQVGTILRHRRVSKTASTRKLILEGFAFLSEDTRNQMLERFDEASAN